MVLLGVDVDEEDHDLLFSELRARGFAVVRIHTHELTEKIGENSVTGELVVYETDSCPTCEPGVLRELAGF